jgi:ribosomal protein S18 acetylase RimI-like enzyme
LPSARSTRLEVRRARPADAERVGTLTARVYREGGWADESYSRVLLDAGPRIDGALVLVAADGDTIIGSVTMSLPGTPFANVCRPGEVELRMLAVDEGARGVGVATRLMESCESFARERGCEGVVLSTEPDMYAAQRLYERRGYLRQPDRDWRWSESTLLVYRLPLI